MTTNTHNVPSCETGRQQAPNATAAEERGDLIEALLPDAAGLACAVREETREEIAARLAGMSRRELEATAVILAAMVDPDRGLKDAFAWIDFDEHGAPLEPAKPGKRAQTVRSIVRVGEVDRRRGVDLVAVERALTGAPVALTGPERTAAVDMGIRRGLAYETVADVLGMKPEAVQRSWERSKRRARAEGRPVPAGQVGEFARAA